MAGDEENKLGQILVLKSLATIYAQCHRNEVNKASGDEAPSMTPVWEAFERRTMMMQAVIGQDVQAGSVEVSGGAAPVVAEAPVVAPSEQQAEQPPKAAVETPPAQPVAAAPAEPNPPAPKAPAGAGPMGFFTPGAKTQTPAAPASSPESPPQSAPEVVPDNVPGTPPAEAAPAQPAADPQATPIATPPAEAAAKDETANNFDSTSAPPASPMGFFKPGAKKTEEE